METKIDGSEYDEHFSLIGEKGLFCLAIEGVSYSILSVAEAIHEPSDGKKGGEAIAIISPFLRNKSKLKTPETPVNLSGILKDYRKSLGEKGGGATKSNFAAFEYVDNSGNKKYLITKSEFNSYHSEKVGIYYLLEGEKKPVENVLRVHSELQPCRSCGPSLEKHLPESKVTFDFEYFVPKGQRKYIGKDKHNKYIEDLFKKED